MIRNKPPTYKYTVNVSIRGTIYRKQGGVLYESLKHPCISQLKSKRMYTDTLSSFALVGG